MANVLKPAKQEAVIRALLEGSSVRSTERMTGVHRDTILRLMVGLGEGCARLLDREMHDLDCEFIQVDEIWSFIAKKQRHVTADDDIERVGDCWVYVAIDADTKLIPSYLVGKRDSVSTDQFIGDLASRLKNRVQISSDAYADYVGTIAQQFGPVDYGQIVKTYEAEALGPGRYSPPKVIAIKRTPILGNPIDEDIGTSFVERQNLTMRMQIRRFTRLTNGFSKKPENHRAAISLWFAYYNFARQHQTLRVSPAMAAGLTKHLWSVRLCLSSLRCPPSLPGCPRTPLLREILG
jgi:IS1 family transposase